MKPLIIGMGEIGKAVKEVYSKGYPDIASRDKEWIPPKGYDVLHIAIPYSYDFVRIVNGFIKEYKPKLTIVHSTVQPGTTRRLKGFKIHNPILGRHEKLAEHIISYPAYYGYISKKEESLFSAYIHKVPIFMLYPMKGYESTECAKILSLVQYAMNIEFARYASKLCNKFKVNYDTIKEFTKGYNTIIERIEGGHFIKSILEPPKGKIGGHCVLPALSMANESLAEEFLVRMLSINKAIF